MSIFSKIGGLFVAIAAFVTKTLSGAEKDAEVVLVELEHVATIADNILNAAKKWVLTPAGQTLLAVVSAIPGVGTIASEVVNTILPTAISAVSLVQSEATTNPEDLVVKGVTAVLGKTDGDEIAGAFNTAQALITNKIAPLLGIASNIQAALSIAQTVHDGNKNTVVDESAVTATPASQPATEVPATPPADPDMAIVNETIKANQVPDETLGANGEHAGNTPVDGAGLSYEEALKASGR